MSTGTMHLMPPAKGTCPACAVDHPPDMPHNKDSMYYQMRFHGLRGRWPTWADALAHCSENVRETWQDELEKYGAWSEPVDGQPIADPPEETVSQLVNMDEHKIEE